MGLVCESLCDDVAALGFLILRRIGVLVGMGLRLRHIAGLWKQVGRLLSVVDGVCWFITQDFGRSC